MLHIRVVSASDRTGLLLERLAGLPGRAAGRAPESFPHGVRPVSALIYSPNLYGSVPPS